MTDRSPSTACLRAVWLTVVTLAVLILGAGPTWADNDHTDSPPARAAQESAALGSPGSSFDPLGTMADASREAEPKQQGLSRFDPRKSEVVHVLGALTIVIGLLFATKIIFTRATGSLGGAGRPSGVIEILARYPVARGQQLILLKVARRVLLVHQNGTAMTTLSEVVDENEVAALLGRIEAGTVKKDAGFKAIFSKFASEHEQVAGETFSRSGSRDQGEVIDLTRRPNGLRNLFTPRRAAR